MHSCCKCGREVSPATAYRKTTGWTRPRGGGGKNQVALATYEDEFMCDPCMAVAKSGVHSEQGQLT